jgi:hypothetical protein
MTLPKMAGQMTLALEIFQSPMSRSSRQADAGRLSPIR